MQNFLYIYKVKFKKIIAKTKINQVLK
jgi:hypothetical protein